jgi:hypothetical protein
MNDVPEQPVGLGPRKAEAADALVVGATWWSWWRSARCLPSRRLR